VRALVGTSVAIFISSQWVTLNCSLLQAVSVNLTADNEAILVACNNSHWIFYQEFKTVRYVGKKSNRTVAPPPSGRPRAKSDRGHNI
jgi:hypothetical protein